MMRWLRRFTEAPVHLGVYAVCALIIPPAATSKLY